MAQISVDSMHLDQIMAIFGCPAAARPKISEPENIFPARNRAIPKMLCFCVEIKRFFFPDARALLLFQLFFNPHPAWLGKGTGRVPAKLFWPRRPKKATNCNFPVLSAFVANLVRTKTHSLRMRIQPSPEMLHMHLNGYRSSTSVRQSNRNFRCFLNNGSDPPKQHFSATTFCAGT
jgi:hypothetical protein